MSVVLNKKPSHIETVNDINSDIVNFFRVLRENPDDLIALLELTPVSREEYNISWDMTSCNEIERARRFYVRVRQSFRSLGAQSKNKGWNMAKTKSLTKKSETVSQWNNGIKKLLPVIERIKEIQIENRDYQTLIKKIDFPGAFFYCDPPYPDQVRNSKKDYKYEFSENDHYELSVLLHNIQGKAMISSYDGDLMNDLYFDWHKIKLPVLNNNMRHGRVQECLWTNYNPLTIKGALTLDFNQSGTGG
jgi:DNA adenine methylase